MKNLFILLFFISFPGMAQSKKEWSPDFVKMLDTGSERIVIRKVYQVDGKSAEELYRKVLVYVRTNKVKPKFKY